MHFSKLSGRAQLRAHMFLNNYILRLLLEARIPLNSNLYHSTLNSLSLCQRAKIRDTVVEIDNRFNEVFPAFDSLNRKFSPGLRISDNFSNYFSFHFFKKNSRKFLKLCSLLLDDLTISSSLDSFYALIVTNASIKNNVVTSIAIISQTPKHVLDMFDFNTTSNPHSYLVLFVSKTPLVVWYFIMDLILPKVYSYFALFESKSVVIFIFVCCLIISFKLCKFTWTLCEVFSSSNLNSYVVFH